MDTKIYDAIFREYDIRGVYGENLTADEAELLGMALKRLGGKPMFYKTGHSLIKAKMKEMNAVFTGEMSGHMFFAD